MHFIRLYARVLGLLAPDKWVAIGLAFSALALAGLQFLEPVLFGRVVDVLSASGRLPATFPATEQTMPAAAKLFLIEPVSGEKPKVVPVPVAPEALPSAPQFFALSPDGRKAAVVEPGSDAVAVLDLATGKVEVVSPDHGKKCRTLPAWRSITELTFATWSEETQRPEVMTMTLGESARKLSGTWPEEAVSGLLEKQGN